MYCSDVKPSYTGGCCSYPAWISKFYFTKTIFSWFVQKTHRQNSIDLCRCTNLPSFDYVKSYDARLFTCITCVKSMCVVGDEIVVVVFSENMCKQNEEIK